MATITGPEPLNLSGHAGHRHTIDDAYELTGAGNVDALLSPCPIAVFRPYRWVRHPFYVVAFLGLVSSTFMTASWFVGLVGRLVVALLTYRTRAEEARLLERFGDE